MFLHNFKYSLKTLFRSKMLLFWTFAFPIILGTFFNMAFSDIENNEKLDIIDIAIIDNEEFENNQMFKEAFETLGDESNDDRIFNIKYTDIEEAKKLLESEQVMTVQEAAERVGISRSSFYKYKDDILPFYDNTKGKTVTFVMQMDDRQGLLSDLLHVVAVYRANILTIHQSIPVNGVATLTLSVEVRADTGNVARMVEEMEEQQGIHYVKILARE